MSLVLPGLHHPLSITRAKEWGAQGHVSLIDLPAQVAAFQHASLTTSKMKTPKPAHLETKVKTKELEEQVKTEELEEQASAQRSLHLAS